MIKNYKIRIPDDIVVFYFFQKSLITFIGPSKTESLKLNVALSIVGNTISIKEKNTYRNSNKTKRALKFMRITAIALLKQCIMNASCMAHQKLKIIGVGYKIFEAQNNVKTSQWFVFKLGYSHLLYFRLPKKTEIFCVKFTTLFVHGNSFLTLTKACSRIRSYKSPEPYKGKGVLYFDEKITLKEGKKI